MGGKASSQSQSAWKNIIYMRSSQLTGKKRTITLDKIAHYLDHTVMKVCTVRLTRESRFTLESDSSHVPHWKRQRKVSNIDILRQGVGRVAVDKTINWTVIYISMSSTEKFWLMGDICMRFFIYMRDTVLIILVINSSLWIINTPSI